MKPMKRLPLVLAVIVLVIAVILYGTISNRGEIHRIVTLTGAESYANLTVSNLDLIVSNNPDSISALPVHKNDLLYFSSGKKEAFYRYSPQDGNTLKFRIQDFKLFLNDRLIAVTVNREQAVLDWLNALSAKEAAGLRHILITDSLTGAQLDGLKKLADLTTRIGVVFNLEGKSANGDLVLQMFDPDWVAGNFQLNDAGKKRLYSLKKIEFLFISGENLDPAGLEKMTNLHTLLLSDYHPPKDGSKLILPRNVKRLSIMESGIRDLEFLGDPGELKELNVVDCDSLRDISALAGLTHLTRIGFTGCGKLTDLSPMDKIPVINRFSFPEKTTDQDLATFLEGHCELIFAEFIGCDSIKNLNPLKELKHLSSLSLVSKNFSIDQVSGLKGMDYLAIPVKLPDDSLKFRELREKMPDTVIVPSAGLCLGTGWILLIIPLLAIFGILVQLSKKRYRA